MKTSTGVVVVALAAILVGMWLIGIGMVMRDPNWSTPYPNTQHTSTIPTPSIRR